MTNVMTSVVPKLRLWNTEKKFGLVSSATSSNDGRFIAIKVDEKVLVVVHNKFLTEDVILSETKQFVWGHCDVFASRSLDLPIASQFIYVLDQELNIIIFEVEGNESSFRHSIVTLIGSSIFHTVKELNEVTDVALISASFDSSGQKHLINCLVNKKYCVQLNTFKHEEPIVTQCILVSEQNEFGSNIITKCVQRGGFVHLLSEHLFLSVLSTDNYKILLKVNLQERLLIYDIQQFDVVINEINGTIIVLLDDTLQLHFLRLEEFQAAVNSSTSSMANKKWPNIWNYRLSKTNVTRRKPKSSKRNTQTLITVPLDTWMNDFLHIDMSATNNTVLLLLESKQKEADFQQCLVAYNMKKNNFESIELELQSRLCLCENPAFPNLLVSSTTIAVPTFGTNQEQLIDTIIQFSGIAQAELICKSNNWDQFSIPMHTLEVGLQHRQIETVAFFLKSREKVFTRFWKSINDLSSSINSTGSPSKSFSSQRSYSETVNSDEMASAIEMLLKAISSCSTGKHKQAFFESLLKLAISYLNHLIQDGIVALQMESYTSNESHHPRTSSTNSTGLSFNFIQNIPEALKYITENLLELRKYLQCKTKTVQDFDDVDGSPKNNFPNSENLEEMLLSGNIATLQKLLFTRSGICSGTFGSLVDYGLQVVQKYLKLADTGKAETMLLNLGLNHQVEIKKIYTLTFERKLRHTLYPYLKNQQLLTQDDIKDFEFIEELEEIYKSEDFTFALQNHSYNWTAPNQNDDNSKSDLAYSHLCLKYVSNFDGEIRRQIIVEGKFISSAIESIKTEDGAHFWKYLLKHNEIPTLLLWLSSSCDNKTPADIEVFRSLPDTLMSLDDFVPNYTREVLINTLVKYGFYPSFLLKEMTLFVKYLTQTNRLFGDMHPIIYYKKTLSKDERQNLMNQFNIHFIRFCEKNDLVLLLWKFLSHYKINSNDVQLSDDDVKSWLPFMLHFHKFFICKDTSPDTLFKTFVSNATYLTDSSVDSKEPICLNDLVTKNQSIVALSIALICKKSLEEIRGESQEKRTPFSMEKDLLKSTLQAYPKVYDALYVDNSDSEDKDVSMYRLLQDNTQLEVRYWFGWQKDNLLAVKDETALGDLPHFSNAFMSERYALDIKLSYDYYLGQARPVYAYMVFLKNNNGTNNNESKERACNVATKLAIQKFNKPQIAASCIVFVELLEGQHEVLKVDIKAANLISKYWKKRVTSEKKLTVDEVNTMLVTLLQNKRSLDDLMTVLKYLEECTEVAIHENKEIDRFSYEAVCHWQLVVRFSRLHQLPLTTCYIRACCKSDNWLQLFLFIHLYQVPPDQVLNVIEDALTNNSLKEHLVAIVKKSKEINIGKKGDKKRKESKENVPAKPVEIESKASVKKNYRAQFYSKLGTAMPSKESKQGDSSEIRQPLTSTPKKEDDPSREDPSKSDTPLVESSSIEIDLFADTRFPEIEEIPNSLIDLLLECDEHKVPWKKLLGYAVASFNPLLAVLAACYDDSKHSECLCIWLICSVDHGLKSKICEHLLDIADQDAVLILRNHRWSSEDLLVIVKCMLNEGVKYAKLICQGFIIFRKTDPLLYLTQFIEAFFYDKEKSVTLPLLAEFQTEYQAFRSRNIMGKTFVTEHDLYQCEDFSLQCILILFEKCPTKYHAFKLLCYLADAKFGFMFDRYVPNFMLAKQTTEIVYPTGIDFSVLRLCTTNIEDFDQEVHSLYAKLLNNGAFEEAYTFAKLHNLPESNITVQKISLELEQMCSTSSWKSLELRCSFWNQADRAFNESNCSPDLVAQFFEDQSNQENDIKTYEERTALLLLSIKWYKGCKDVDQMKLSQLEKKVWLYKIKGVKETQQTGILSPKINLDGSKSDSIVSFRGIIERKCSDVSYIQNLPVTELLQNEDMDYLFELQPTEVEDNEFALTDLQDQQAFEWLVGNLLDDLQITEARKVASYFQKTTTDLEIILTAIRLAQGQLAVERCSDTIKAILAGTTSRHISVSGILERSGSFTRPESLTKHMRSSDASDVMVDFVFIEEVQNALEKLTIRISHGKKGCQQVLICFKVANILSIPYEEVVNDDCMNVLKQMLETKFDHQKQLAKQFIKAFNISTDEVSTFVADLLLSWVRMITGEAEMIIETSVLSSVDEAKPPNNEDILALIQLAENSSLVGSMILQEAANISNEVVSSSKIAKLTYQVELLVYAHYCFTITCDMEGIAGVLRITHHCTKFLAKRNQYSLMVRLLTGIGRFREMFYIIETLYNQHHFEVLCRKGKGDAKENQLKMALLDFMRRYHPEDSENLNMISVGFGMYREAAQHLEKQGLAEIERIKNDLKGGSKELVITLEEIQKTFSYAANNYSKEECLYQEQSCTRLAHLAKLQIQLLQSNVQVLGLTKLQVQDFLNNHTDFIESLIVADCYDLRDPSTWTEPLYRMVILKGNFNYLEQFQNFFQLTPTIATNVAKRFRSDRNNQTPSNMKKFLHRLRDVRSKIKIARELNFTDIEKQLLEGPSGVYMRDHIF